MTVFAVCSLTPAWADTTSDTYKWDATGTSAAYSGTFWQMNGAGADVAIPNPSNGTITGFTSNAVTAATTRTGVVVSGTQTVGAINVTSFLSTANNTNWIWAGGGSVASGNNGILNITVNLGFNSTDAFTDNLSFRNGLSTGLSMQVAVGGTLSVSNTGSFTTSLSFGSRGTQLLDKITVAGLTTIGNRGQLSFASPDAELNGGVSLTTATSVLNVFDFTGTGGVSAAYISGIGTIQTSPSATTAANGTLTINGTSGTASYGGVISNGAAGSPTLALVKSGNGSQTLTGVNTYTGKTTINGGTLILSGAANSNTTLTSTGAAGTSAAATDVQITGGMLQLGASNQIVDTAKIGLSGGTLNLNGSSEGAAGTNGVGALTLSATSTIDFGATSGANLVQFGGLGTHTGGAVLTIVNWEGTAGSANGTDRLLFAGATTDFTGTYAQSEVSFNGVTGYGITSFGSYYEVFEIAAVPEPATWVFSVVFIAGSMVCHYRRRRHASV